MERYEIVVDDEGNYCGLIPSENGPLVQYADAQATIAALQDKRDGWVRSREHYYQMIEKDGIERRRAWAVVLGLVPEKDGNQWSLLWGKTIQEGVCGFGDTPEAAVWDFEKAMNTPLTATSQPVKPAGKMHACDIPGCVSCGNPEDTTSQEGSDE